MTPNPIWTIWTSPRQTVRRIVAEDPNRHVVLLVCLAGIGEALNRASTRNAGDKLPVGAIIAIAVVLGPLGGLLGLWIYSHLIRWTGTWLGGKAPREHVRTAIAWSSVPAVFALPLWIPELLLFGSEMFTQATPRLDANPALAIPLLVMGLLELVLGVWAFVLLCNTVAEVQGFHSAWRGLLNLFLAGAVIIVPIILIVLLAVALTSL
jgi:hypothetical protein